MIWLTIQTNSEC